MTRKFVTALLFTVTWAIVAIAVIGASQFGDCYLDEPHLSACLSAKAHSRQVLLIVFGLAYVGGLWLILRRRKLG